MASNILERKQPVIDYRAGRTRKIGLPREHYYEAVNLVLTADVEITDAAAASRNGNGILDLVDTIKVEYNGSKTPKSNSFAMSHFIDKYEYGSQPLLDPVDFESAGEQTAKAQTYVQFLMEPRHLATPLPSFLFSTLDLEIKWNDAAAVGEGITVNDAEIKVETRERKRDSIANESKLLNDLMVFKETEIEKNIPTSGPVTVDLPQGNVYHSIPTLVIDDGVPTNDLIEQFEVVENGVDTHFRHDFDMQQADDFTQYGVESPTEGFIFPGYAVGGDIDDVVDSGGMDSYNYELDTGDNVPTDATAKIVTRELIL